MNTASAIRGSKILIIKYNNRKYSADRGYMKTASPIVSFNSIQY